VFALEESVVSDLDLRDVPENTGGQPPARPIDPAAKSGIVGSLMAVN